MPTNRRRTSLSSRIGSRFSKCEALEDRRMLSVAHGDFNGDGYDDLAIGVPNEEVNGFAEAGAVNVIYGSPNELDPIGNQLWTQDSPSIFEEAEAGDRNPEQLRVRTFCDLVTVEASTEIASGLSCEVSATHCSGMIEEIAGYDECKHDKEHTAPSRSACGYIANFRAWHFLLSATGARKLFHCRVLDPIC